MKQNSRSTCERNEIVDKKFPCDSVSTLFEPLLAQEGCKKGKSEHVVNKSKANRASQSRWETIGIPMIDDGKVVHLHHRSDVYLIAC